MGGGLLVYVAGGLFVAFIEWSLSSPRFDYGDDSRWILWTLVAAMVLTLAGHLSGGVL